MERIICDYINNYLEKEKLLYSCETQIAALVQDISSEIDQGYVVDAVMLDFSKAFDKVPFNVLKTRI